MAHATGPDLELRTDSTVITGFSSDHDIDPEHQPLCAGILNWGDCGRVVEAAQLARYPQIRRDSTGLHLPIEGGSLAVLADSRDDSSGSAGVVVHTLVRVLDDIDAYLVAVHYYEGGAFLLVSRQTGKLTKIDVAPAISPDRRRLVTASWSGFAGYGADRLRIYELDGDSLLLEWEYEPEGEWVIEKAGWLNDSTVMAFTRTFEDDLTPVPLPPVTAVRADGIWRVERE